VETAYNVVQDALREIVVSPAETPIESYDASVGVFYLNAMMLDFAARGVNLGYTIVGSLGDNVTIDDGAYDAVVKNLAIVISPVYKETLTSQDLFKQAEEGFMSLLEMSFKQPGYTPYPENLSKGSGNYNDYPYNFYSSRSNPLLTERGGNVAPESTDEG